MTTQTERGTCTGQGLVHVEHLTKHYRKTPALRDYSLSLDSGHIVGLMGPNGCGKTTLLKILAGVLSDYAGIVTIRSASTRCSSLTSMPTRPPRWWTSSDCPATVASAR